MKGRAPAIMAVAVLLAGCAGGLGDRMASQSSPSASAKPTHDRQSLPTLFDEDITGGGLQRGALIGDYGDYTSHEATFRSGDVTVSGVLSVPDGEGPFPGVVLNHGYIETSVYATGQGMPRERDYFARAGFVVLHNDYRGHAGSDDVPPLEHELRLGYARDAVAAVKALRALPEVTDDQVALAGRSMGGAVTFGALVAEPGVVDAAVVWASVSSVFVDNFRHWTEPGRPERARAVVQRWGTVDENPEFWAGLSPRTYFDRIDAAVMMHHGTQDESCPYPWAEETRDALRAAGVDLTFHAYEGETHTFTRDWELSMERTVDFLKSEMGV